MSDAVLVERSDGVLTITLNEPDRRNALTAAVEAGLLAAYERAADPAVRAVVLTGAGGAFCAGGNVREMEGNDPADSAHLLARADHMPRRVWKPLFDLEKPVIASIDGWAVGAGVALALGADVRIASDRARFRLGFSRVGIAPDMASSWMLPRIVGLANALEWLYSERDLDAAAAQRIGLVHEVVGAADLTAVVADRARHYASGPTRAYAAAKRLMQRSAELNLDDFIREEAATQLALLQSDDHREGVAALRDKRPPRFEGC